jgi:hypothetical protein
MEISQAILYEIIGVGLEHTRRSRLERFTSRQIRDDKAETATGEARVDSDYEHMFDSSPKEPTSKGIQPS